MAAQDLDRPITVLLEMVRSVVRISGSGTEFLEAVRTILDRALLKWKDGRKCSAEEGGGGMTGESKQACRWKGGPKAETARSGNRGG